MITIAYIARSKIHPSEYSIFTLQIGFTLIGVNIDCNKPTREIAKLWCDMKGFKAVKESIFDIYGTIDNMKRKSKKMAEEIFFDLVKEGKIHLL